MSNKEEYISLFNWFETFYARHEQKYNRMIRLNDTTENWVDKLQQLDAEAETKRQRMQELEEIMKGGESEED